MLAVRADTVRFVSQLVSAERRGRGSRGRRRALGCYRQAVLVLRWFLDATRLAQVAADNRIGVSMAYRYLYLHQGIDVRAAAGRRLQTARTVVAAALGLLLTGVLLTWWAPAAPTTPPAYLKVTRSGGTVCGTLQSADSGTLRLTVTGTPAPVVIPLTTVTNLAVTPSCP